MPFTEGIAKVRNPCRGICSTSTVGSIWCVGCGRYYKDVINWNAYDESQQDTSHEEGHGTPTKEEELGEVTDNLGLLMKAKDIQDRWESL